MNFLSRPIWLYGSTIHKLPMKISMSTMKNKEKQMLTVVGQEKLLLVHSRASIIYSKWLSRNSSTSFCRISLWAHSSKVAWKCVKHLSCLFSTNSECFIFKKLYIFFLLFYVAEFNLTLNQDNYVIILKF